MTFRIVELPKHGPLFEGAIAVYGDAFGEPPYSDPDRGNEIRSRMKDYHGRRPGYEAFAGVDDDGRAVGMIYGYRGEAGQWWHDTVAKVLTPPARAAWLGDSYELVEVAVDPRWQGHGVGTALIARLLRDRTEATCVLSTRTDSQAHRLYRRLGFEQIRVMVFAPGGAEFYVMGKSLHPG